MYKSDNLKQTDNETFTYIIDKHKDFKILQLTDLHLGFGFISRKKDKLALNAVTKIIHKAKPDMIVLTGDSIFPFLPKAGTLNNRKQAYKLMKFMDSFAIPYTLVFGNHDCEMGSTCNKEELAQIYKKGKYCIFTEGRKELTGVGNFFINLTGSDENVLLPLVMLDSNMYGEGGWFYSGFDRIHDDQVEWCMNRLNDLKKCNPDIKAMAFFHMPPAEFKEAYRKMKLGDKSVIYQHGSIAEKNIQMPDEDEAEANLKRTEAIIHSMTAKERKNPDILNPSRKNRIARGAGVNISEVNRLVKQFEQMKKMMKQMPGMMKGAKKGRFKLPF